MIENIQLEAYLAELLTPEKIKDYCPNGLQVEGNKAIKKIVTGVTASQALIDKAIELNADAILVHHGYFWKGESEAIKGIKGNRIRSLIKNDINLFAYHLPLDVHPVYGNNAQLANLLDISSIEPLEQGNPFSVSLRGELANQMSAEAFAEKISKTLNRQCLHLPAGSNKMIKTVAWCTGGGQSYIDLAGEQGIDAFISGEASEKTTHSAHELDIHYFGAGHHATERYGVKSLGEHIAQQFNIDVAFIDINNPV